MYYLIQISIENDVFNKLFVVRTKMVIYQSLFQLIEFDISASILVEEFKSSRKVVVVVNPLQVD